MKIKVKWLLRCAKEKQTFSNVLKVFKISENWSIIVNWFWKYFYIFPAARFKATTTAAAAAAIRLWICRVRRKSWMRIRQFNWWKNSTTNAELEWWNSTRQLITEPRRDSNVRSCLMGKFRFWWHENASAWNWITILLCKFPPDLSL